MATESIAQVMKKGETAEYSNALTMQVLTVEMLTTIPAGVTAFYNGSSSVTKGSLTIPSYSAGLLIRRGQADGALISINRTSGGSVSMIIAYYQGSSGTWSTKTV